MKEIETDIVIVGSGLVGLVAAHCLSSLKYNIALVDKKDLREQKYQKKDIRTVAISEGSKQFLEKLRLWDKIKKNAEPIKKIKVVDRNPSNHILFENCDNRKKLGYVIENSIFSNTLLKAIKTKKNVKIFSNCDLKNIYTSKFHSFIQLNKKIIKSKLTIAADGKQSAVRNILGDKIFKKTIIYV